MFVDIYCDTRELDPRDDSICPALLEQRLPNKFSTRAVSRTWDLSYDSERKHSVENVEVLGEKHQRWIIVDDCIRVRKCPAQSFDRSLSVQKPPSGRV